MARSDLLISLVRAGSTGNQSLFRKATEALIAEERAKQHDVLADRIAAELRRSERLRHDNGNGGTLPTRYIEDLVAERVPELDLAELTLSSSLRSLCQEFVEEHHRASLLRSFNLEPRHRVLLVGPPGNGKTSLAEALAHALMVPFCMVRYEGLIGSYLGETAGRLARLFDHLRTQGCVLFFDEFDTIGKERGDVHETGEIKRVVSSLLLQIDALPSHVVVIAASNHPELLDRAVWRRFQVCMELSLPGRAQIIEYLERMSQRLNMDFQYAPRTLADKLRGASFAELEDFVTDIIRRRVLSEPAPDIKAIVRTRLEQWQKRIKPADE